MILRVCFPHARPETSHRACSLREAVAPTESENCTRRHAPDRVQRGKSATSAPCNAGAPVQCEHRLVIMILRVCFPRSRPETSHRACSLREAVAPTESENCPRRHATDRVQRGNIRYRRTWQRRCSRSMRTSPDHYDPASVFPARKTRDIASRLLAERVSRSHRV